MWNPKGSMMWMGPTRVLGSRACEREWPPHLHCSRRRQEVPTKRKTDQVQTYFLNKERQSKRRKKEGQGVGPSSQQGDSGTAICNVTLTPTPISLDLNCSFNQTHNKISNINTSFCCLFFPLSAILFQKNERLFNFLSKAIQRRPPTP